MRTACRQIFEAKCIGALIEVVYSIILFSIVLGISTALTFCVFRMELDATQRTIVVIACMQVDNDLLALFIAAIRV